MKYFIEERDNMVIEWDAPITMCDGTVLRCDIYRPVGSGQYPVILSYGPYGKGLLFSEGYPLHWEMLVKTFPEVTEGVSGKYINWETVDPERFIPWGYACMRIDSRGAGNSEGFMDLQSPQETLDLYDCIEWAAKQDWCDGKVAMSGISYYASNQWSVASLRPPHLAACIVWEGALDYYREYSRSGGIMHNLGKYWAPSQVYTLQHGNGERGYKNRITGENLSGNTTLSSEKLLNNRRDYYDFNLEHEFFDKEMQVRLPDVSQMTVPLLSSANWGGAPMHPRGNFEGFQKSGSKEKFLEVHGELHWGHFYSNYGLALQKQFLDYYVKGIENGWKNRPGIVQLQVRHVEHFEERFESNWPIPRTVWQQWYLTPSQELTIENQAISTSVIEDLSGNASTTNTLITNTASITYDPKGNGITFLSAPFVKETEFTGPMALKLFISSESEDADIFAIVRLFSSDMTEVVFQGSNDPKTPIALGWLRASHRELDTEKTLPYRPYHTHRIKQPLTPGEVYELDIEIHPTGIVIPPGYRIGLSIRGKDYIWSGYKYREDPIYPLRIPRDSGVSIFQHDDPIDRPISIFGANVTLHFSNEQQPYLLLPYIPAKADCSCSIY